MFSPCFTKWNHKFLHLAFVTEPHGNSQDLLLWLLNPFYAMGWLQCISALPSPSQQVLSLFLVLGYCALSAVNILVPMYFLRGGCFVTVGFRDDHKACACLILKVWQIATQKGHSCAPTAVYETAVSPWTYQYLMCVKVLVAQPCLTPLWPHRQ